MKASALTNSGEEELSVLEAYRDHVADRAAINIPPKPLSPQQVADLVELLKAPPADEKTILSILYPTVFHRVLMKPLTSKPPSCRMLRSVMLNVP